MGIRSKSTDARVGGNMSGPADVFALPYALFAGNREESGNLPQMTPALRPLALTISCSR